MVPEIVKGQIRDPGINQSNMNGITLKIKQNRKFLQRETGCIFIYLSVSTLTLGRAKKNLSERSSP